MASEQQATKPNTIEFYGGYQVYSDTGIDLTLLRENLKRTVEQRLESNARALELVRELQSSNPVWPTNRRIPPMLTASELLRQLNAFQVEYVLIGGLAMTAHGSAHVTQDLDICYLRTSENLVRLTNALAPLHPYLRGTPPGLPFRLDVATVQAGLNFTLTTDLGDVDLLGEVAGIGMYDRVVAQAREQVVFGLTVRVLSLDGLIASKKAAGRTKDRNHLLELEELKKLRDANP
jgi:hypothetical protein